MIGLQNHFCRVSCLLRHLPFAGIRRLACAIASGVLLGGCASSPVSTGTARAGSGAEAASPEYAAPAAPLTRGDIPDAGNPAGIQLYAQTPDGVFLLVADHIFPVKRGWAGFGGMADAGETIAQTAARETEEETRGYFKREDLLAAIAGQEPVFDGKFAFYFVKVDKVPAEEINRHSTGGGGIAFAERGPYTWVPYSEVERYLDQDAAPTARNYVINNAYLPSGRLNTRWFWPVWLNNFRAAHLQNAIPWP